MQPFRVHTGLAVPLDRQNIDTDAIIPKQFPKRVERAGFGQFLFFDWRFRPDGQLDTKFLLNEPRYHGATILLAGKNFGCGSSREHAPWALTDFGFRAIIAPDFADIFAGNSAKNGLLLVALSEPLVQQLMRNALDFPEYSITVDLERCEVRDKAGFCAAFTMDEYRRQCLLNGWDDIALTLQHEDAIRAYEERRQATK